MVSMIPLLQALDRGGCTISKEKSLTWKTKGVTRDGGPEGPKVNMVDGLDHQLRSPSAIAERRRSPTEGKE